MAIIFNEWAKRYTENPAWFLDVLDENGHPIEDYGELCATYFDKLARELDAHGKLPQPWLVTSL